MGRAAHHPEVGRAKYVGLCSKNVRGLWHVLALFHVSLALQLARFMVLLNLSFALNRICSP